MTIGLILAGGKSSRFGEDKALYYDPHYGKTWVELAFEKLSTVVPEVFISANAANHVAIQRLLPTTHLLTDLEPYVGEGPLSGLYAAAHQSEDLLLLSVDNPELSVASLQRLLDQPNSYVQDYFTLAHMNFQLSDLSEFLEQGNRRVKDFLKLLEAQPIKVPEEELVDHNRKQDSI